MGIKDTKGVVLTFEGYLVNIIGCEWEDPKRLKSFRNDFRNSIRRATVDQWQSLEFLLQGNQSQLTPKQSAELYV